MKALVLAGGTGSRLRPFTDTGAKQLLPIANKPVLFYGLEAIAAAGVREAGIVVGRRGAEVREAVGDGSAFGLCVSYLQQERPLGLAHAVLIAREFLGDDDFLLYLGDNYLQDGLTGFAERAAAQPGAARLLLTPVADPTAFGVAELDAHGDVVGLEEKPERPRSDLALIGVYAFGKDIHEAVRAIRPSVRGELEITDAVQWLLDRGLRVRAETTTRPWRDTGSVDDLLEVNRQVLDGIEGRVDGKVDPDSTVLGRVRLAEGAVVRGSRIVGPAVIGAGTVISNSSIGPYTAIAEDCRIEDSAIAHSVLLRGADVEGASRIESSLIGRGAVVAPAPRLPQAHRLVIGDHSKVQLTS
ncbi:MULTISPECIES: glucose-1-phosphate thymidylyltransferase [Streptomyces]|uniref:Glucose-1-phosphate thymidylyltransferase n=1 Tax=Streptomyces venezuelae TaxID=54571 RepID=A0A5P2B5I1_STRVZ|nr:MULTISPECIES: glucose-1-phosphate thymidylyltransferase [Streptomyces]NEA01520.1 glucose-1-phosphate thymidylyltransferase [Streptomyces sp. SID10116]MYY80011.1 glucose-1-phosphate thymidylyltransferase [Streptomyces sp. SID335]MYZ17796.1 glucose-1-phosphate thymidylyltransferase [Streptomyces sp. SID337]NDZ88787.1 glucose-1-phosphate thymidylyltransferase [Streptomyces sp. SID10115]NEB47531.1 glucose-1-phosphate thymidylyltransferase [Streptomyces sp. SID339]